MPSGRRTPSTLITSAPREPRSCVATGPAQKAVRSVIRMSDNGSASAPAAAGPVGPRWPVDAAVVRAQSRWPSGRPGRDRVAAIRHPRLQHPELGFDEHAALHEVVDRRQRGRGCDGGHRDSECHREIDDLLGGAGLRPLGDHADELVAARDAPGHRGQLRVVDQVGAIDHHQEVLELLRGDGAEADHAVGRGDD